MEPTHDRLPRRRRGGQELPDNVQDRPEQNAGYDAAVRGQNTAGAQATADDTALDVLSDERGLHIEETPPEADAGESGADRRAERGAVAEVRRQNRRR